MAASCPAASVTTPGPAHIPTNRALPHLERGCRQLHLVWSKASCLGARSQNRRHFPLRWHIIFRTKFYKFDQCKAAFFSGVAKPPSVGPTQEGKSEQPEVTFAHAFMSSVCFEIHCDSLPEARNLQFLKENCIHLERYTVKTEYIYEVNITP